MENLIKFNSIDEYNKAMGFETKHPLVAVVDLKKADKKAFPQEVSYYYGVYALFLKQTYCGDITYGRMPYDYQEGTVTSFAPGQVVHVKHRPDYEQRSRPALSPRPYTRHVTWTGDKAVFVLLLFVNRGAPSVGTGEDDIQGLSRENQD